MFLEYLHVAHASYVWLLVLFVNIKLIAIIIFVGML